MTASLSADQVQQYERDGFVFPIRAFPAERMAELYGRMQAFAAAHPGETKRAFGGKCHLLFPWLYDVVADDTILDTVESVIGPNILCWSSGFFNKDAHDPAIVSWHQDSTYWGLDPMDIITAWVAFTPSTVESGCMRVIPGTHTIGQLRHEDTFAEHNLLSRGQEITDDIDLSAAVDIELQPGEMSLHHVRIVHGSGPNTTDMPRFGLTIRYIPTHVRQHGGRTTATLVRGVDEYDHFDPEPRPASDYDEAALAFHGQAIDRVERILYDSAAETGRRTTETTATPPPAE